MKAKLILELTKFYHIPIIIRRLPNQFPQSIASSRHTENSSPSLSTVRRDLPVAGIPHVFIQYTVTNFLFAPGSSHSTLLGLHLTRETLFLSNWMYLAISTFEYNLASPSFRSISFFLRCWYRNFSYSCKSVPTFKLQPFRISSSLKCVSTKVIINILKNKLCSSLSKVCDQLLIVFNVNNNKNDDLIEILNLVQNVLFSCIIYIYMCVYINALLTYIPAI